MATGGPNPASIASALAVVLAIAPPGCGGSASGPSTAADDVDASIDATEHVESGAEAQESSSCQAKTCDQLGAGCGGVMDGCGGKLWCGECQPGKTCGGGGVNQCGTQACAPWTCAQLGASCGNVSNGCDGVLDCGLCPAPTSCGAGGVPNHCGCSPRSCSQVGAVCGTASDGCGASIECGSCPAGQHCGGAGANQCGTGTCTPKTCAQLGAGCGIVSDSCGTVTDCGGCPEPGVCGGDGVANQCGCLPKTCGQLDATCGKISNGCGFDLQCGDCPAGTTCGANGVENQCGSLIQDAGPEVGDAADGSEGGCPPLTCVQLGAECGIAPDGCGGVVDCGACPDGQTCGAAGPNQCGYIDGSQDAADADDGDVGAGGSDGGCGEIGSACMQQSECCIGTYCQTYSGSPQYHKCQACVATGGQCWSAVVCCSGSCSGSPGTCY